LNIERHVLERRDALSSAREHAGNVTDGDQRRHGWTLEARSL